MSGVTRTIIKTTLAPGAIATYSQAVKVDKTMYISGQLGLDAKTMEFAGDDVKTQANMALTNIGHILKEAGMEYSNVVKTTVLLADINDFAAVNEVYKTFFSEPYPARAAYAVAALPKLARVEIEAIAVEGPITDAK